MKASRFTQQLQRYLSADLPDDHANVIEIRQIRTLHVIILFVALLATPLIYYYYQMELGFMAIAVMCSIAFAFFTSWLLNRTRNYVLCGHLAMLDFMSIILLSNLITDGFTNTNFGIFYAVPVIAAFILGISAVFTYTALALGILLIYYQLDVNCFDFPYLIPEENRRGQSLLDRLFVLTMLAAVSIGFLFHRNFTEKQLERSREREELLHKSKSRFFANMSHEIRTPMNSVIGLTEMLMHTPLNETQAKYVKSINRSGNTLMRVINDVLDYSFIESGKLSINRRIFDLHELINDLQSYYTQHKQADIKFQVHLDDNLPRYLITDDTRLHQILTNLLNNAFKFTETGSIHLTVNISDDKKTLSCEVKDSGIGISSAGQKKLFNAFEREALASGKKYGGTGLGLNICKMLIDTMGGKITCTSNLHTGTCMYFELPVEISDVAQANLPRPAEKNQLPHTDLSNLKVLVAEDNPTNQLVIKAFLDKLNIACNLCENGAQALAMITENPQHFDVLLLDCEMPVKDGFETAKEIRAWEKQQGIAPLYISAFTAHAFNDTLERCKAAGMDTSIAKPLKMEELIQVLTRAKKTR